MEFLVWKEQIERERKFKNDFFLAHPQSPLPELKRENFKGLDYYPPNIDYKFELRLHEFKEKNTIKMHSTHDKEQEYVRWGEFRFKIHGKECNLRVYKRGKEELLFIPFKDKTNGKETYGAGRYLDLRPQEHYLGEGKWILDFNRAYNPWCAYSEDYTCPFTPTENWLDIPICAGEKNYNKKI
jgi:uncharacterized protein (DUF1684 family)